MNGYFDFAQPLSIDPVLTLPDRVILAPMQGVMSPAFVRAAVETGITGTRMTPFFSVGENSIPSGRALRKALRVWGGHESGPLIVQLAGCHADSLAETSYRLLENGYPYINLNFGCPSRQVMSSGHGGACLKDPQLMYRLITAIHARCGEQISLSVKMRTGYESPEEMPAFAAMLRDTAVRLIILHFRTVKEEYRAVENPLPRIARFRELLPDRILIGNGDIKSEEDARRMIAATGCDGVALARMITHDPFLLNRIRYADLPQTTDQDRYRFLYRIFVNSADGAHWKRNGFLENVRMTFGADSPEFRRFITLSKEEMEQELQRW
ncbi:MAG: tRNA-dihydrouridine synthase family protein [Lentisphaeria bacterium]|nr:tRNA-dihydrouridine synthase family protein [Lentisphaeria bacterium]